MPASSSGRSSSGSRPKGGASKKSSGNNNPVAAIAGIVGSVALMLIVGFVAFYILGKSAGNAGTAPASTTSNTPGSSTPANSPAPPAGVQPGSSLLRTDSTLVSARSSFKTRLKSGPRDSSPVDVPPSGTFILDQYDAPVGRLFAYVSPDPGDGKKHPAIIWITGGDCNSIGEVWLPAPPENDQTAAQYRQAGMVMMYPSLRGGNNNPGQKEGFLGEVDDVLAAAEYLLSKPYVDPENLYLGGHSTGGTLVLLVAASTNRFKAIFSFGPADQVAGYGAESGYLPYDVRSREEHLIRSPIVWVENIQSPVYVFEGGRGNASAVVNLQGKSISLKNRNLSFHLIQGTDHFRILQPANWYLAEAIRRSAETKMPLEVSADELKRAVLRN
ncbi:alpha/beta hydrolase family protein [Lacunimicrobium album]